MPRPLAPDVLASTAGDPTAVRLHILDAAYRVIVRDGLAQASTRAIAEEAGVASGTLYNYFEDRLQLVAQSMLRRAEILAAPLHELPSLAGSGTVSGNLRRSADALSEMLDGLVPLFAAAFSDGQLLEAIRRTMLSGHGSSGPPAADPIEAYLRAERALGRVSTEADCSAAASLVVSVCHERAFLRYFFGRRGRRNSIADQIDFIAGSIATSEDGGGATSQRRREP